MLTRINEGGDTSVDLTERPDSKFMIPSKQPALTLVALAAAEDPGRQLPDSGFSSGNQVACKNPTSTDRIASSFSATSAYIAPARDSPLSSNEPAVPQTTGEDFSPPPVGNTDSQKTDVAPSSAASRPGNPRGSDGPTGDACESTSGRIGFRTASMYEATLDIRMLGEMQSPRTASAEEDLRGRDHSRLLDGTTAGAPGGALDRCTTSFGNPRGTDGPSGAELSPKDLLVRSQDFSRQEFSRVETRPGFVRPKSYPSCCPTRVIMPIRIR